MWPLALLLPAALQGFSGPCEAANSEPAMLPPLPCRVSLGLVKQLMVSLTSRPPLPCRVSLGLVKQLTVSLPWPPPAALQGSPGRLDHSHWKSGWPTCRPAESPSAATISPPQPCWPIGVLQGLCMLIDTSQPSMMLFRAALQGLSA